MLDKKPGECLVGVAAVTTRLPLTHTELPMPLSRKKSPTRSDDPWLSAHEASRVAGLSRLALYERALNGELRSERVAGRRVFDRTEIEQLAATQAVPASQRAA